MNQLSVFFSQKTSNILPLKFYLTLSGKLFSSKFFIENIIKYILRIYPFLNKKVPFSKLLNQNSCLKNLNTPTHNIQHTNNSNNLLFDTLINTPLRLTKKKNVLPKNIINNNKFKRWAYKMNSFKHLRSYHKYKRSKCNNNTATNLFILHSSEIFRKYFGYKNNNYKIKKNTLFENSIKSNIISKPIIDKKSWNVFLLPITYKNIYKHHPFYEKLRIKFKNLEHNLDYIRLSSLSRMFDNYSFSDKAEEIEIKLLENINHSNNKVNAKIYTGLAIYLTGLHLSSSNTVWNTFLCSERVLIMINFHIDVIKASLLFLKRWGEQLKKIEKIKSKENLLSVVIASLVLAIKIYGDGFKYKKKALVSVSYFSGIHTSRIKYWEAQFYPQLEWKLNIKRKEWIIWSKLFRFWVDILCTDEYSNRNTLNFNI
ncbi:hypothetical protein PCANB_000882 [Pneumocystis canis]|nr:hypothetical protein PCANB_000882 [Pneumocystis canis]